jgi:hypothetical protein
VADTVEDPQQGDLKDYGDAAPYLEMIEQAQRTSDMQKWDERCRTIRKKYRYESSANVKTRKYQMLWSNMEVMKPAVYAKAPQPVCQRRFRDADPTGRVAVEMLERACRFQMDINDFGNRFESVRDDYLLYARGTARVFYEPVMRQAMEAGQPEADDGSALKLSETDPSTDANVGPEQDEYLDFEHVKVRYVQREDFVHAPSRTWDEVGWASFRAYLGRDELVDRWGKKLGNDIPLSARENRSSDSRSPSDSVKDKAEIWEMWDKDKQKVRWLAKGYDRVLEEVDPYLKLTGFYPCPKPAYGTLTNDSLVPVPDYVYYQDQQEEVDTLTARIASLQQALKLVGFYAAGPQGEGTPEVERAMSPGFENKLIAVKSFAAFKEGGKEGAFIIWLPVEQVATILKECVELRKQLIEDIYQIVGISDIMRGDAQASETATAQSIKAQFGSVRIRQRQNELARFARDIIRLTAEIVSSTFQPETLLQMCNMKLPTQQDVMMAQQQQALQFQQVQGQYQQQAQAAAMQGQQAPPPPQPPPPVNLGPTVEDVVGLLRDKVMQRFRVDIEADSTIVGDESQERQDRTQFIQTTTEFVQVWGPIVQQNGIMAKLAGDLLLFGTRSFRVGRELEETIEETVEKLEQAANQPPPPDPKIEAEKVKLQGIQMKADAEGQKAQMDVQATQAETKGKLAEIVMDHQANAADHTMRMEQTKMDMAKQIVDGVQGQQEFERSAELSALQHKQKMQAAKQKPANGRTQ